MRTKKSVPPDDKVVPSTDKTVLSSDETMPSIEKSVLPTDETISPVEKSVLPSDDVVSSPDDATLPKYETTSPTDESALPVDGAISPTFETAPIDDVVSSKDETMPPTLETAPIVDAAPSSDEIISPTEETTPIIDAVPSNDEITAPIDDAPVSIPPILETTPSSGEVGTPTREAVPSVKDSETWRELAEPWWKATLAVLPTFLITRFIFLLLSYFGGVLFFVKNYVTTVIPFHEILYRWDWWDAKRFATIAAHGYVSPDYAAFFPLYPTIVHVLTVLTHRDVLEVSMFTSNVAFLGMLIVLYRFVTVEFDKDIAKRTVLYISIFPTALFFFAGYNESLFLFFTLLCFYTVRRGSWWLAGLFGLLATLTRSSGLFLALVFVWEYLRQNWPLLREEWQSKELSRMVRPLVNLVAVFLIPLGLAVYSFGLYRRFHDPLEFIHAQSNWRVGLTFPLYAPLATLKKIVTLPLFTFVTPHNIIDLTAAVLFATLLVMCFIGPYRLDRSQWTFPLFGILILITTMLYPTLPSKGGWYDPLASTQRLVLEAFVGFIILARLGRRPWFHQFYLLISLPMLAFLTLQFMTGHWTV